MSTTAGPRSTRSTRSPRSCSSAASGATRRAAPRSTSRTPRRARRSPPSPTRRRRTPRPRWTPPAPCRREWAAHPPRERGEILRRACEAITERADDLALLMTLEMGKPLAESKAEVTYAVGVLPLVRRGGGADRGPLRDRAQRRRPPDHDAPARRPVLRDHALELPDGDGHAQDRPGDRRRLHDGRSSPRSRRRCRCCALAEILEEAGLPAGVLNVLTSKSSERRLEADHRRPAAAQAHLHGLDRGRADARRAVGRAGCCGSRWSSAATRRSSSSRTPTSTPPSTAR